MNTDFPHPSLRATLSRLAGEGRAEGIFYIRVYPCPSVVENL